jgi:hypothetical protein
MQWFRRIKKRSHKRTSQIRAISFQQKTATSSLERTNRIQLQQQEMLSESEPILKQYETGEFVPDRLEQARV